MSETLIPRASTEPPRQDARGVPRLIRPMRMGVALAPYTTWQIGGPAEYLAEPEETEVEGVLSWARERNLPVHFLGRGSNVLISDQGLRGVVILTRASLTLLRREGDCINAGAGVSLPRLSQFAAREGFRGYEFLIGIPGTVGGGVVMNAGLTVFQPREIRDILVDVTTIASNGTRKVLKMTDLDAGYRTTILQGSGSLVTSARFQLIERGDPGSISAATIEHLRERKAKQPLDKPTAGSTFKSPPGGKSAGWYIEQAGIKGFRVGAAQVSHKHANWIENLGGARSAEILRLLDHIEKTVAERFGITLEREVRYLA